VASERSVDGAEHMRFGTREGRWVIAATALGSGVAFLDGTVVNVALPAIADDFHSSLSGLQWTVDAYLVMLSALLLLGGSLGDHYGRRNMYVAGLGGFTLASLLCAVAPSTGFLVAARAIQGVGAALLVPGSLSIIAATFSKEDRGQAIGAWSGLAGVSSALGPFLGGWLIQSASWRFIFLINLPLAGAAIAIALKHIPETRAHDKRPLDIAGALVVTASLALLSFAAIQHEGMASLVAGAVGVLALVGFVVLEGRIKAPMMPLELFRNAQFTGANLVTVAVYAALSGAIFLVVLQLQETLHYSPLEAGGALVPFSLVMLALSSRSGRIAAQHGPRAQMTIGPIIVAAGLVWFGRIGPGDHYLTDVLPAVLLMALGMATTVAPLTAAVLAEIDEEFTGIASGINNAVSRLAGLLAVAGLPALAGVSADASLEEGLRQGYVTGLNICAVLCVVGGVVAVLTIRKLRDDVHHRAHCRSC